MILYSVTRPKNTVIVAIMYNLSDNKYHFVNLAKGHICSCAFDSVEDAVKDLDSNVVNGKVLYYNKVENTAEH